MKQLQRLVTGTTLGLAGLLGSGCMYDGPTTRPYTYSEQERLQNERNGAAIVSFFTGVAAPNAPTLREAAAWQAASNASSNYSNQVNAQLAADRSRSNVVVNVGQDNQQAQRQAEQTERKNLFFFCNGYKGDLNKDGFTDLDEFYERKNLFSKDEDIMIVAYLWSSDSEKYKGRTLKTTIIKNTDKIIDRTSVVLKNGVEVKNWKYLGSYFEPGNYTCIWGVDDQTVAMHEFEVVP